MLCSRGGVLRKLGTVAHLSKSAKGNPSERNIMKQHIALSVAVLAGPVVGGVAVGGLNAQTPSPSSPGPQSAQSQSMSQLPRYFVITEQEITDQQRYSAEYAPKVTKTILDHQGRFVVRNDQITPGR
jgi:hypothetical protein